MVWCGVLQRLYIYILHVWCGVMWCDVVWWLDLYIFHLWCGVVCDVVWCDVMCGVVECGGCIIYCIFGMVLVWCGVVVAFMCVSV